VIEKAVWGLQKCFPRYTADLLLKEQRPQCLCLTVGESLSNNSAVPQTAEMLLQAQEVQLKCSIMVREKLLVMIA